MAINITNAAAFLGARLGGEVFTDETPERQAQALQSAQDALTPYSSGVKGADLEAAVYLQALWMLSARFELQSAGVASYSLTGITETFNVKGRPVDVAPEAWRVLKYGLNGRRNGASAGKVGPTWLR